VRNRIKIICEEGGVSLKISFSDRKIIIEFNSNEEILITQASNGDLMISKNKAKK